MANPVIDQLISTIAKNKDTIDSAIVFINSVTTKLIPDAIAAALKNGATEAELAPFTQLITDMSAKDAEIATAIVANTPAAPPTP